MERFNDDEIEVLFPSAVRSARTTDPYGYHWESMYDPASDQIGYRLVRDSYDEENSP